MISINWHVLSCLCLVTKSVKLACIVLSVLIKKCQVHACTICCVVQYHNGYRFSSVYIVQHDSVWARIGHPEMRWPIVLVLVLQSLHLGSAPLWRMLAWTLLGKRLWLSYFDFSFLLAILFNFRAFSVFFISTIKFSFKI